MTPPSLPSPPPKQSTPQTPSDAPLTPAQQEYRQAMMFLHFGAKIDRAPSLRMKQYCQMVAPFTTMGNGATTEAASILNDIALGTGIANRVGNYIRMHRIEVHGYIKMYQLVTPATTQLPSVLGPSLRAWIWNDKVPNTSGTIPVVLAADSITPGSSDTLFGNFGTAITTRGCLHTCARNPVSVPVSHVYLDETYPRHGEESLNATDYPYTSGAFNQVPGYTKDIKWDVPLHGLRSVFLNTGAPAGPLTNQLALSWRGDTLTTYHGITIAYSLRLMFEDEVDGLGAGTPGR